VEYEGSILAGRGPRVDCRAVGPAKLLSRGYNVARDGSCELSATGDLANRDPLLAPLADNGGPSPSHSLLPGSPAFDGVNPSACPSTDQRGAPRPAGRACDVGAVELGAVPPAVPSEWPLPPRPVAPSEKWRKSWPCVWPTASPTASATPAPPTPMPPGPTDTVTSPTATPVSAASATSTATSLAAATATSPAAATATSPAAAAATPLAAATATPLAASTATPRAGVCPQILGRVPPAVIADGLANPRRVYGFGMRLDPNKPAGPMNPPRRWLSMRDLGTPFHVTYNTIEFKAYCP
jgi:hypothetical protein